MSRTLALLGTAASLMASTAIADAPKVATDIAPVHSLVARVMAGVGNPDLVIAQGASPHEYSLRPSEARALQSADVVFWIGEDLTPWLEEAIETLADDATVVSLLEAQGTELLDFRESALFEAHDHGDHVDHEEKGHDDHDDHAEHGHDEHGHDDHGHEEHGHDDHGHGDHDHEKHGDEHHDDHDHEKHHDHDHADTEDKGHDDHDAHGHGDHGHDNHDDDEHADGHDGHAHGAHDPHAWLSPDNAALWLNTIAATLSAADPENAGAYFANATAGRQELEALSGEIDSVLDPVRGKNFIVFHDAYQYFETDFDFPASGAISLSDATDPSPARIAQIRDRIVDQDISCVLSEPQYDPKLIATVMEGAQAETAVLDPLGFDMELGPDMYPNLLRNLANALADCL